MTPKKRIGILTRGGNCAGLNAAILYILRVPSSKPPEVWASIWATEE